MQEAEYFLITTADERGWEKDHPVLCLGTWCRTYKNQNSWEKLNARVVPYHWDNRNKLYSDYLYLRELNEILIDDLTNILNKFHKQNHTRRYWQILIGPWLLYFTQILFDRWEMLQKANNDFLIRDTLILDYESRKLIPGNMDEFRELYTTDLWNFALFSRIIEGWLPIKYKKISTLKGKDFYDTSTDRHKVQPKKSWISKLFNLLNRISLSFTRNSNALLISTFLPLKHELLLQLLFGQFPGRIETKAISLKSSDITFRNTLSLNAEKFDGFENCLRTLIIEQIPTNYIEGYNDLVHKITLLGWPKYPKFIFTSVSYNSDDLFKAWAGDQVEKGSPLILAQHGGNIGTAMWSSTEDHEIAISDHYITWGWGKHNPKNIPVGILKNLTNSNFKWNPNGAMLFVSSVMPRYSYVMGAYTVANSQVLQNLEDQFKFVESLNKEIIKKVIVRLFIPDWGWDQADRWSDRFPDVKLNNGSGSIESLMSKSRLYIATYNATTFLEALSNNIPTIAFWNPEHWELREEAKPYFNKLQEVEILFSCPKKASAKAEEVWNDVGQWWHREDVQNARIMFCKIYANKYKHPVKELKKALIKHI